MVRSSLPFGVSPPRQEMRCWPRDNGTAQLGRKRRTHAESVDWRTKEESLTTRRNEACVPGPDNAKEICRAEQMNGGNIDD